MQCLPSCCSPLAQLQSGLCVCSKRVRGPPEEEIKKKREEGMKVSMRQHIQSTANIACQLARSPSTIWSLATLLKAGPACLGSCSCSFTKIARRHELPRATNQLAQTTCIPKLSCLVCGVQKSPFTYEGGKPGGGTQQGGGGEGSGA